MRFLEVAGAPGVGKSTILDPHYPQNIPWDGKPLPGKWNDFLLCVSDLLRMVNSHPSAPACRSMMARSLKKVATVGRMKGDGVYVGTGLVQRGYGIGWRLADPEPIRDYYRLMPVDVGVALLWADVETVQRRNRERGKDRAHMVPFMERPREIAAEVLRERGVRVIELDTRRPVAENVAALKEFAL